MESLFGHMQHTAQGGGGRAQGAKPSVLAGRSGIAFNALLAACVFHEVHV